MSNLLRFFILFLLVNVLGWVIFFFVSETLMVELFWFPTPMQTAVFEALKTAGVPTKTVMTWGTILVFEIFSTFISIVIVLATGKPARQDSSK